MSTSDSLALAASPCCGTAEAAHEAGACCDPAAKAAAIDAGGSCCTAEDTAVMPEKSAEAADSNGPPVVVIGAGPVGMAAAAELAERGIDFLLLESGSAVGAAVGEWGHVRVFSPWRYNVAPAARRLLEADGWVAPDPALLPTGAELIEQYLAPLAKLPGLVDRIRFGSHVTDIAREGIDRIRTAGRDATPFAVRLADGAEVSASAVIDASGTWLTPNPLGGNGLPAAGERQARRFIESALPDVQGADRDRFAGRHTLVVGAGHSAANTLLSLAMLAEHEPDTRVSWAIRAGDPSRAYGGEANDALPARGALGSRVHALVDNGKVTLLRGFSVAAVGTDSNTVTVTARDGRSVTVDRIVAATGYRPDHGIAAELRLDLDPILGSTRALAPMIDPNHHSCGTVPPHGVDELAHPEPGFYAVGAKSYGRAPTFLMATGYEQVRSIVAALAGDWATARDVQLELPETGVCSSSNALGEDDVSCCGNAATVAPVSRVTGVGGGPVTLPITELTAVPATAGGCCDS